MKESFLASIGSSILWRGLDRLSGLLKHIVIAATIGLSAQLDVFYMALAILGMVVFSWGLLIETVAVPKLVQCLDQRDKFQALTGGLFVLCCLFSLLLLGVIWVGHDILAGVALGFDEARGDMLGESFIWLIPVAFFYIPYRFLCSIFRAKRSFSKTCQAEFIVAIIVLTLVVLYPEEPDILLWSYSVGFTLSFFFLLVPSMQYFNPWGNPFSSSVLGILRVAPSLLVLQMSHFVYVLSDRVFISFLQEGSVGALAYGLTFAMLVPGLIGLGMGFLTLYTERKQAGQGRSEVINDLMSVSIFFGISVGVFFWYFNSQVVTLLLERGVFKGTDTILVSEALACFSIAMLPFLLIAPLDQVFQVESRLGYMVNRTLFGMVVNIVGNGLFLFVFHWGVQGIALATAISYWVMLLTGLQAVTKLGINLAWKRHLRWGGKLIVFSFFGVFMVSQWEKILTSELVVILEAFSFTSFLLCVAWNQIGREGVLLRGLIGRVLKRISVKV